MGYWCCHVRLISNIYIRPLSSVQNKLLFILHEPHDLSWPLSGRSFGKTCIIALRRSTFLKEKQIYHVIKFSFVFELTDSLSQLNNKSKSIHQAVKLSKILIILIAQFQYPHLRWMMTVTFTSYFWQSSAVQGISVASSYPKTSLMLHSFIRFQTPLKTPNNTAV